MCSMPLRWYSRERFVDPERIRLHGFDMVLGVLNVGLPVVVGLVVDWFGFVWWVEAVEVVVLFACDLLVYFGLV